MRALVGTVFTLAGGSLVVAGVVLFFLKGAREDRKDRARLLAFDQRTGHYREEQP